MLTQARDFLISRQCRWALVAAYVFGGLICTFVLPDTPDEISRIADVRRTLDGQPYPFFWPAGNMAVIFLNPLFHLGWLPDVQAVRVFNLLVSAPPVIWLIMRCPHPAALAAAAISMPYMWLVTTTASQQGLMFPLLVVIVWAAMRRRHGALATASAALYVVNPAMLVVVPTALALAAMTSGPGLRAAGAALMGAVPFFAIALGAWALTGEFRPTLSSNGALNLWLGNNPDPLAHRGVASGGRPDDPLAASLTFIRDQGSAFWENILRKASLYWAPWDYMRSGMGGSFQPLIFTYVACAQVAIYGTVIALRRHVDPGALATALCFAVMAWLLYTAFFVKLRFRVPFDLLLLASIMLPTDRLQRCMNH